MEGVGIMCYHITPAIFGSSFLRPMALGFTQLCMVSQPSLGPAQAAHLANTPEQYRDARHQWVSVSRPSIA